MLRSWRELSWKDYKNAGRRPVKVGGTGERGGKGVIFKTLLLDC